MNSTDICKHHDIKRSMESSIDYLRVNSNHLKESSNHQSIISVCQLTVTLFLNNLVLNLNL